MKKMKHPNYNKIYLDLLKIKFPEKVETYRSLLTHKTLSVLDVIKLNESIFSNLASEEQNKNQNQRYKAYNRDSILEILDYQKKNHLNNSQLAKHFHLSRNTVAKWKKIFII